MLDVARMVHSMDIQVREFNSSSCAVLEGCVGMFGHPSHLSLIVIHSTIDSILL